jgi:glycerol-3-phosphate dehydrogenase (NAD(P)+)
MTYALGVIGSGAWGTALAIAAARTGARVALWGPDPKQLATIAEQRCNRASLGEFPFPDSMHIEADFASLVQHSEVILLAVPSHVFNQVLLRLQPVLASQPVCWATKGLDPDTEQFPSEMLAQCLSPQWPMAVLSGPSFAKEVARGAYTAVVVAANQPDVAHTLQHLFEQPCLQIDLSDDIIGVQLGGTAKNVIAIATGMVDSVAPSANTRAALITRGLQEIHRLGIALGARTETCYGLAGVGDLLLTCSDDQSRNRRFGLALGQGSTVAQAEAAVGQVVEGLRNTAQVARLAQRHGVAMPITVTLQAVLAGEMAPAHAIQKMIQGK